MFSFQVYSIVIQQFYRLYSIKSYYKVMVVIPYAIQYILFLKKIRYSCDVVVIVI